MTLLEFILEKYLGPPTRRCGNGHSFWPCPHCENPRFQTMPLHPKYKHRAKCYGCGFMEDAAGLLREFHSGAFGFLPLLNYADRQELLYGLEREWRELEQQKKHLASRCGVTKRKSK